MQSIIEFDRELLLLLNGIHNHFFDAFMWMLSSKEIWGPVYLVIIYYFFKNTDKKKALYILGACILCIVLCDQISSSVFKPFFERWRPSRDPLIGDLVHIVNGKRGGKFGFVSSHAANVFGLAVFSSMLFKNKSYTVVMLFWAVIVSYSRVYLGVHFPGDILCGGILGAALGYGVYKLLNKYVDLQETVKKSLPSFMIVMVVTFFCMLSVSRYMYFAN